MYLDCASKTLTNIYFQNTNAQAALQAAQAIMGNPDEMAKTILRVIIDNMLFQINIDILCQVRCSSFTFPFLQSPQYPLSKIRF